MTLFEIVVVIGLIALLAGILILMWPNFLNQQAAVQGTVDLQGYLGVAAANARRDQVVWGVRLLAGATTPTLVTSCQYLRQPDDFFLPGSTIQSVSGSIVTFTDGIAPGSSQTLTLDFTNGEGDPTLYAVQPGDFLIVNGGGQPYQIAPSGVTQKTLTLLSPPQISPAPGSTYRIIRSPRVTGDEVLNLPSNVVVDLALNTGSSPLLTTPVTNLLPVDPTNGNLDILFAPSGKLFTPVVGSDPFLALWVRNVNARSAFELAPRILAVFVNTGLVSAHVPNNIPNAGVLDPYLLVRQGRSE